MFLTEIALSPGHHAGTTDTGLGRVGSGEQGAERPGNSAQLVGLIAS